MNLTEAIAVMRNAGLDEEADRIEGERDADLETGFLDHRQYAAYPSPHQDRKGNALIWEQCRRVVEWHHNDPDGVKR